MDEKGELEEYTHLLNGVSALNMHKIGFTKVGNTWVTKDDVVANTGVGAHDNEVGLNGVNQANEEDFEHEPMAIELYNALEPYQLSLWKNGFPLAQRVQCVPKWASQILQC